MFQLDDLLKWLISRVEGLPTLGQAPEDDDERPLLRQLRQLLMLAEGNSTEANAADLRCLQPQRLLLLGMTGCGKSSALSLMLLASLVSPEAYRSRHNGRAFRAPHQLEAYQQAEQAGHRQGR